MAARWTRAGFLATRSLVAGSAGAECMLCPRPELAACRAAIVILFDTERNGSVTGVRQRAVIRFKPQLCRVACRCRIMVHDASARKLICDK
eukprot:6453368-Prymnesium_polylepis.1